MTDFVSRLSWYTLAIETVTFDSSFLQRGLIGAYISESYEGQLNGRLKFALIVRDS